jgi:hypothetical protein
VQKLKILPRRQTFETLAFFSCRISVRNELAGAGHSGGWQCRGRPWRMHSGLLRSSRPAAFRISYLIALYGSVLTQGEGNDIDVFAVPFDTPAKPERFLQMMEDLGFVPLDEPYTGLTGTLARQYRDPSTGYVIDLEILEAGPRSELLTDRSRRRSKP